MSSRAPRYDIFVSYRRDGGYETALPIVEKLRSACYRVFFDLESMNAGKFNEQLIDVIDSARDFVLVLPEHGLDRCQSPDDWVRREITHALAKDKNIIPVMLKGFTWPDNLPDDMSELPHYQGISASSPEHFDMAVERLKGYLLSKPRRPLRKWLTIGGIGVAAIVAVAMVTYLAFRQLAKPVCTEAGTRITLAMDVMHRMSEVCDNFYRTWGSYLAQRDRSAAMSRPQLDSNMMADIADRYAPAIEELRRSYPDFSPMSSYDKFLLGLYDVDPADIDGLRFIVDSQAEQCVGLLDLCRQTISQGLLNTSSRASISQGNEAERHGMNVLYYRYLEFMSHMPQAAWASHRMTAPGWHLYPTAGENLGAEEYARLADLEQTKMNKAIEPMRALTEMLQNSYSQHEEYLDDLHHAIEEAGQAADETPAVSDAAGAHEVAMARERVESKRRQVAEVSRELSEAERRLRAQFDDFRAKYAIDGSEGQYLMWGKVCKAASHLATTVRLNSERAALGMTPTVTNAEALQFVTDQLDAYTRHHPDTGAYADAARAFYAEVARGVRGAEAMIVMGTQHDAPHPLLRVGDIIVERNGVSRLPDFKTYSAAAKSSEPGTIRLLRLEGGQLREIAADFPATDINIGLFQLKD